MLRKNNMLRPLVCIAALCLASSALASAAAAAAATTTPKPSTSSSSPSAAPSGSKAPEMAVPSNRLLEMVPFDLSWLHALPAHIEVSPSASLVDHKLDEMPSMSRNQFMVDQNALVSHNQAALRFDQSLLDQQMRNSMVDGRRRFDGDEMSTLAANNRHLGHQFRGQPKRQHQKQQSYQEDQQDHQLANQDHSQVQGMDRIVDSYAPSSDRRMMQGLPMADLDHRMPTRNYPQQPQQRAASQQRPRAFDGSQGRKQKGAANRRTMNVANSRPRVQSTKIRGQESRGRPVRPRASSSDSESSSPNRGDDDDEIFRDDDEGSSSTGPMSAGSSSSDRRGDGNDDDDYNEGHQGGLDSDSSDHGDDADGYERPRQRDSSMSRPLRHGGRSGVDGGYLAGGNFNPADGRNFRSDDSSGVGDNSGLDGSSNDEDSDSSAPSRSKLSAPKKRRPESEQADESHVTSSKTDLQAAAGHHHGHHGHYYQHVEVPKKKAWKFGFKRGNHKHEIERHEKGYKHKFHSSFKWHAKEKCKKKHKCKSVGKMTWDYKHHKKHHG